MVTGVQTLLFRSTALSGCNPFSSFGSEEAASASGASASAGLDPRYAEGAFGAWSASLHTDAGDARALSGQDASSGGGVQGWVDADGGTAVFAYSRGDYASTLTVGLFYRTSAILLIVFLKSVRSSNSSSSSADSDENNKSFESILFKR